MVLTGTAKDRFEGWFKQVYQLDLNTFYSLPNEMKYGAFERFGDEREFQISITPSGEFLEEFYLMIGEKHFGYHDSRESAKLLAIEELIKINNKTPLSFLLSISKINKEIKINIGINTKIIYLSINIGSLIRL